MRKASKYAEKCDQTDQKAYGHRGGEKKFCQRTDIAQPVFPAVERLAVVKGHMLLRNRKIGLQCNDFCHDGNLTFSGYQKLIILKVQ